MCASLPSRWGSQHCTALSSDDRADLLCTLDSRVLREFSRRCVDRLDHGPLLAIPLPFLRTYLNANVDKEVEKDAIIIRHAAARFSEERPGAEEDIEVLYRETRQVDRAFLRKVRVPSFSLDVREQELAGIRKERIRLLSRAVEDILRAWSDGRPLERAVRAAYTRGAFTEMLGGILSLYTRETRQLSGSIKLFGPLQLVADAFAVSLERTMNEVADELVISYADEIYAAGERT